MAIVIDINSLSAVFSKENNRHNDFCEIKKWIESGEGCMIYGGTKYKEELKCMYHYTKLIRYLKDIGKVISINDEIVDKREKHIIERTIGTDCDDQHIIALLGVSHCSLLCSSDERSYSFVRDRSLYPKGSPKVKIYKSKKNISLLKKQKQKIINIDE